MNTAECDMANTVKSIIPFLPRPLKYLLLFVIFANFRSWPFAWHFRVFAPFLRIRLYQLYLTITRQPRKVKQEYKESLVPLGENPLEVQTVHDGWAGPDDCDYNFHLSNSSYPKILDTARFKLAIAMTPTFLDQGGNIFLGGTHFNFIREIPIGSRYQIRMRVVTWDKKWIYVAGQYCIPPRHKKVPVDKKGKRRADEPIYVDIKDAFENRSIKSGDRAGDEISSFGMANISETPSIATSGRSSPAESSQPSETNSAEATSSKPNTTSITPSVNAARTTKDGWIVACTSLSVLCCKYGRSTVPPSLAFAVSGLMVNGKEEWNALKRMRATGEIKHLLKGGWRNVTAESECTMGKGLWWEEMMKREGVMDEVERRMGSGLGKLRETLEFVGSIY